MDEGPLTTEEIGQLRRFFEVEKIKKKKMLYSQLMDGGEFEAFVQLYTPDCHCEWGPFGTHDGHEGVRKITGFMGGRPQFNWLHMTTNLWVELTGPDTASSRCYLHDVITEPHPNISPTARYAVYEEDWVKIDGDWKIRNHRIYFLWPTREKEATDAFASKMVPTALA